MNQLDHWSKIALTNIRASGDHSTNKLIVSLMYDPTKVVKQFSICPRTKLGVGKCYSDHIQNLILLEH